MNYKFTRTFLFVFIFQLSLVSSKANDSCALLISTAKRIMQNADYKTAIMLLDSCLKMDQTNATAYNLRGCATIFQRYVNDEKNNKTAIIFFNKALRYDSTNYFYLNNRGWAYQSLDDNSKSYSNFKKAVQLDGNNVELQGNVLRNLWIRNKYKDAYAYSEQLIRKFPSYGYAWYVRGQLKRDYLHKYPEGNKDIKKGKELSWKQGFSLMY